MEVSNVRLVGLLRLIRDQPSVVTSCPAVPYLAASFATAASFLAASFANAASSAIAMSSPLASSGAADKPYQLVLVASPSSQAIPGRIAANLPFVRPSILFYSYVKFYLYIIV